MIAAFTVLGLTAAVALAWLAGQLRRRSFDTRLAALTGLVLFWVLALPFGLAALGSFPVPGLDLLDAFTVGFLLRMAGAYCLVLFFLHAVGPAASARRQSLIHAVPLVAASVALAVVSALIRPEDRPRIAETDLGPGSLSDVSTASVYYMIGNVYFAYAFATVLVWTHRHRREAHGPLRRGLGIAEVGGALLVVAVFWLIVSNAVGWAGVRLPVQPAVVGLAFLVPGCGIFLVGLLYPAARMRLAALVVWREHRDTLRRLQPLWRLLHREFPEIALDAGAVGLAVWAVHRRYYRCLVECRDGLLCLSPWLAAHAGTGSVDAAAFHRALAARSADPVAARGATLVAAPRGDTLEDDEAQLVALADALARAGVSRAGSPGSSASRCRRR